MQEQKQHPGQEDVLQLCTYSKIKENIMPKKPVKIILKFSNNSTECDHKSKKSTSKPKKSASNGNPSARGNSGPRKLRP